MKKQILIALIGTALAAPFAAQAQSQIQGAYVGVNVGRAEQSYSGPFDDKDNAFKLYGGMMYDKNFGAELGYVDLGEANTGTITTKPRAFYAAATGTYPLNEQFSLSGKVGVSFNRVKVSGAGLDDESRASLLLGVGAAYNFAPNLAAVLEYEHFGKVYKESFDIKADMVSVGLRYKF
jgi:OOP family OmpA-OmpF porin